MRNFGILYTPIGKTKELTCHYCGKIYIVRSTIIGSKYCTRECFNNSRRKANRIDYEANNTKHKVSITVQKINNTELHDGMAKCNKCKCIKDVSMFYKDKSAKRGFGYTCKSCTRMHLSKYERSCKNKEERNKNRRILYAENLKYRLNNRIRKNITRTIREGSKNGRHWESLVGYSIDKLMSHLEKQFDGEMSWENYGTVWHIDHIVPLSALNFEKPEDRDFKIAWGLKNLRPLIATDNLRKGKTPLFPVQRSMVFKGKMKSE